MGNRSGNQTGDDRLCTQIDAITQTLAAAEATQDLEQREKLLETAARALDVTRREQHERVAPKKRRPTLQLIKGGVGIAAILAVKYGWEVPDWLAVSH